MCEGSSNDRNSIITHHDDVERLRRPTRPGTVPGNIYIMEVYYFDIVPGIYYSTVHSYLITPVAQYSRRIIARINSVRLITSIKKWRNSLFTMVV